MNGGLFREAGSALSLKNFVFVVCGMQPSCAMCWTCQSSWLRIALEPPDDEAEIRQHQQDSDNEV